MVKQLIINPDDVRKHETIQLGTIPVNAYCGTLTDELAAGTLTRDDAVRIFRDMALLREFETMLDEIKRTGKYRDIAYFHQGPAHLSIGQEAAAVGEAYLLAVDDHIFGSHRSHGEILAKGLTAIHRLGERELQTIMEEYLGGDILRVVEREAAGGVKELALNYVLYGLLAEIFGRATGFNRGLGGSMHAFFPPFGIYPNNAIVGGSGDIAVGSALLARVKALLRRSEAVKPIIHTLQVADLEIDSDSHTLKRSGEYIELTPTEFSLLVTLAGQPGRAFSRLQLLEASQGVAYEGYERSIDAHIKNLRAKIEPEAKKPKYIETVFGIGYRFTRG